MRLQDETTIQAYDDVASGPGTWNPAPDMSSFLGGGGGASSGADLSGMIGAFNTATGGSSGTFGNMFGSLGGLAFGGAGQAAGQAAGAIVDLFAKPKTNETQQSNDINKIAAHNGISGSDAAKVVAWHADHSSDNFNDLAAYVANDTPSRFDSLLAEYNAANPNAYIAKNSAVVAAQAQASSQQALVTTAISTPSFAATSTGQQFVQALQAVPSNQAVGTSGQTAGDILKQVLKGVVDGGMKGGSDAAAETSLGKQVKSNYIQDWVKDNQLLAAGLGAFGVFGAVQLLKVAGVIGGRGSKISL